MSRMRLREIIGKPLTGEWGNEDLTGTGVPVLRTTNFTNDGIISFDNVVTRDISPNRLNDKWLKHGDIIIEKSGGSDRQPVGRVVYYVGENNTYTFNNFTSALRVQDQSHWNPKFVFYALFYNYAIGGTRKYENKTTGLHNLKLNLFVDKFAINWISVSEQNRIVAVIDAITHLISLRQRQAEKLDELVKARFVEMFGDPVLNCLHTAARPMTEICQIIDGDRGKNYPKADDFFDKGDCLFLNAKNVTKAGFNFDECMFITKDKDNVLRKGKLQRGDIILTTRGTIGNLAFYTDDVPYSDIRINSGMVILRMNREYINPIYFIEQFKMQLENIKRKIASGTAQPQLPISTMNKIKVIIPDIRLQANFANFVHEVDREKERIQRSAVLLETLKRSLMQQYFG